MSEHHLDAGTTHAFFDKEFPPRLEIDSGDTVTFELREALDGQITPESTADEFDVAHLQHWRVEGGVGRFRENDRVAVPFAPFCGILGVAPAEAGRFETMPPRRNGGNVDVRHLKISEIVNPNVVVSFYLPLAVVRGSGASRLVVGA